MLLRNLAVSVLLCFLPACVNGKSTPIHESEQLWAIHSLARQIDLAGSVTTSSSIYTLGRVYGSSSQQQQQNDLPPFKVAVHDSVHDNLSWFEASLGKGSRGERLVTTKAYHDSILSATIYKILFPDSLASSANITLTVAQSYNHAAKPLPETLEQASTDGQYLLWTHDLLAGAALLAPVGEAKIRVKMPTPQVQDYTIPEDFASTHAKGSQTIVYSSKNVIPLGTQSIANVHYMNPEPIISFRNLKRLIQVSHWANSLAVEDQIEMINNGPKLKGHFSRLLHQQQSFARRTAPPAPHVLTGLTLTLPPRVHSPYYYDTVGNVSTSHFRSSIDPKFPSAKGRKESCLELKPRYPLLGGWTYNFTVGYVAPLQDYLKVSKGREYVLNVPFMTAVKDVPADNVEVRIQLPESASDIKIVTPFPMDEMLQETTYTYLDTTGRPTIVLKKTACAQNHGRDVLITYHYSILALMQKPLAIFGGCLLVSLVSIAFRRLDWRLETGSSKVKAA